MANEADSAFWAASKIPVALVDSLAGLFAPDSRFFPPYILAAIILAGAAYYANRKNLPNRHQAGFFKYLFAREVYAHPSALVDLKVTLANRLFTPLLALAARAAIIISAQATASMILGSGADGSSVPSESISLFALVSVTIAVVLASDFTTYWVHRLHHEHPVLWPFHKLHHSAETMTPLTFARKHPVYDLFRALSNAAIVGPVQGLIFVAFGIVDVAVILGVNAAYALFHWLGSNLRHTHIWLSYGPVISRVLISPAQHQIHHSCAAAHHDKNYGEVFAFWDWMFGTLYVPEGYEQLQFGLADANGVKLDQPHATLKAAWAVPLKESGIALRERGGTPAKSSPPAI